MVIMILDNDIKRYIGYWVQCIQICWREKMRFKKIMRNPNVVRILENGQTCHFCFLSS